jgi:hypothetical protein
MTPDERAQAACKGYPTGWWYAQGGAAQNLAQQICSTCPVRTPCRDEGRRNGEAGTWGGETEERRHRRGWQPTGPDPIATYQVEPPQHGTIEHARLGCKCVPCNNARRNELRRRRRLDKTVDRLRLTLGRAR